MSWITLWYNSLIDNILANLSLETMEQESWFLWICAVDISSLIRSFSALIVSMLKYVLSFCENKALGFNRFWLLSVWIINLFCLESVLILASMDSSLIPVSSLISSIVLLLSLMHINIKVCSPFNMHFVFEIKHSTLEYFAVQTSFFFSLLKLFLKKQN